jgi:hypothetical protein
VLSPAGAVDALRLHVNDPASMLIRFPGARELRHQIRRIVSVIFGVAFVSAGAWFLYRHLVHAGFFDPWFALLASLLVAAGLGLLWLARR